MKIITEFLHHTNLKRNNNFNLFDSYNIDGSLCIVPRLDQEAEDNNQPVRSFYIITVITTTNEK